MNENIAKPENDYSKTRCKKSVLSIILIKLTSVVLLVLLTSYQNPNIKGSGFKKTYSDFELRDNFQNSVNSLLNSSNDNTLQDVRSKINKLMQKFFEGINYKPVWTNDFEPNQYFRSYISLLDSTEYYGFPLDYFDGQYIKSLSKEFNKTKSLTSRVELELATTFSSLKLMLYLNCGIVERDSSFAYSEFIETLPAALNYALQSNNLKRVILAFQPDFVQFRKIINSLPSFIDLQQSIKYTTPKFIDDRMLAKSLYYAGMTETAEIDSNENSAKAIYKLQEQFNLPKDSILNKTTHQALVSLLQYRYYQTCLNLQRLRAMQSTEENFLFVNIPEFRLHVIESKKEKEVFNVIVGKKDTPTPIFSSSVEKVVTNPLWTVPRSIVEKEMLQKIRKDSTYLKKNDFYVINGREEEVDMSTINWNSSDPLGSRYYLRQKSSSSNALGLVNIFFPNEHSVYIHDTPVRGLFKEKMRYFSHGCIRLENPDKLAQYLTDRYVRKDSVNIKNLISTRKSNEVSLKQKVKIHINYITCAGKENSDMEFYSDIYNLDKQDITKFFPVQRGL